jgi:hypothetical protein
MHSFLEAISAFALKFAKKKTLLISKLCHWYISYHSCYAAYRTDMQNDWFETDHMLTTTWQLSQRGLGRLKRRLRGR